MCSTGTRRQDEPLAAQETAAHGAGAPPELVAGRYEVLALAATGGVGEIYEARDRVTAQRVALKRLRSDRGDPRRFAREAALLAALDHPGVVRYLGYGIAEDGDPFLVMEWLEGEDLGTRLERGPLRIAQTLVLAKQLARALGAAHRRGVMHRDLKPANVFLLRGQLDQIKLVDFGLARTVPVTGNTDDGVSVPGMVLGTPAYMAPEQVRAERTDARTDVYALGGLLFSCLTGRPPFRGPNPVSLLATVLLEAAPSVRAQRPRVPAALEALVLRMLAKNASQRPRDGDAALAALEALDPSCGSQADDAEQAEHTARSFDGPRDGTPQQAAETVALAARRDDAPPHDADAWFPDAWRTGSNPKPPASGR